jgi:uncharacterized membrane protein YphA (DoxX/SURF4 family)
VTTFLLQAADIASWCGAVLLACSGVLKLRHPRPARQFMSELGLPAAAAAVRAVAGVELVVAALVLAWGTTRAPRLAEAALFAGFALTIAAYARRHRTTVISCGCFGSDASVRAATHLVGLVILTLAASVGAVEARPSLVELHRDVSAVSYFAVVLLLVAIVLEAVSYARNTTTGTQRAMPTFATANGTSAQSIMQSARNGGGEP